MKKTLFYAGVFLGLASLASCKDDDSGVEKDPVIIHDNAGQLRTRVSHQNSGLISFGGGNGTGNRMSTHVPVRLLSEGLASEAISLALVAEVAPPTFEGNLLRRRM